MTVVYESTIVIAGLILILIAIAGGKKIEIKEVKIGDLTNVQRSIIGVLGIIVLILGIWQPTLLPPDKNVIYSDYEVDTTIHNIRFLQLEATSVNDPPRVNDRITIEFTLQNVGNNSIKLFYTFVAARDPFGKNKDFGHSNQGETIQPQEKVETKASIIVDKEGDWEFWPCYKLDIPETTEEYKFCTNKWQSFPVSVEQ